MSRQGVQRDLLPLVEGTTVSTKYGMVKTDHILFIASGAFHLAKPSDLIPELQGRFPIRVELESLSVADFEQILTSTDACLTRQYEALLATEGVTLEFAPKASAPRRDRFEVNERTENIGARRLYTVMEKLLEEVSFNASETGGKVVASTPPTSTSGSKRWRSTKTCRATCCKGGGNGEQGTGDAAKNAVEHRTLAASESRATRWRWPPSRARPGRMPSAATAQRQAEKRALAKAKLVAED